MNGKHGTDVTICVSWFLELSGNGDEPGFEGIIYFAQECLGFFAAKDGAVRDAHLDNLFLVPLPDQSKPTGKVGVEQREARIGVTKKSACNSK